MLLNKIQLHTFKYLIDFIQCFRNWAISHLADTGTVHNEGLLQAKVGPDKEVVMKEPVV